MRTSVKAPFAILLALAILAGCKSESPKTGYLRVVDGEAVQFIQWTQEGSQIKGTFDMLKRKPDNEIESASVMFDGVLDGENFSITTKDKDPVEKITGRLKGDTLAFLMENGTEHEAAPVEFRRATPAEYAEASGNLEMHAKTTKTAK